MASMYERVGRVCWVTRLLYFVLGLRVRCRRNVYRRVPFLLTKIVHSVTWVVDFLTAKCPGFLDVLYFLTEVSHMHFHRHF